MHYCTLIPMVYLTGRQQRSATTSSLARLVLALNSGGRWVNALNGHYTVVRAYQETNEGTTTKMANYNIEFFKVLIDGFNRYYIKKKH